MVNLGRGRHDSGKNPPARGTGARVTTGWPRQDPNWPPVACLHEPWWRQAGCGGTGQTDDGNGRVAWERQWPWGYSDSGHTRGWPQHGRAGLVEHPPQAPRQRQLRHG